MARRAGGEASVSACARKRGHADPDESLIGPRSGKVVECILPRPIAWCCCPRSMSRAARLSSWSRAGPARRSCSATRGRRPSAGSDAGAEWLHLVDLDAAFGRGNNAEIIAEVTSHVQLEVELSGGIRDDESLQRALATGCARVNIGTAALEQPDWCEDVIRQYGDRIAIGLDVRGHRLAARGWTQEGGELFETLTRLDEAGAPGSWSPT